MSIANYKRPKLTNPYTPLYSPISIHSSKQIDIKKRDNNNNNSIRSVSFFHPKRRIDSFNMMNRSLSVNGREEHTDTNYDHNNEVQSLDENMPPDTPKDSHSSVLDIFHSSRHNILTSWKHKHVEATRNNSKRYNEKSYLFITNKQRKYNSEGDHYKTNDNTAPNNEVSDISILKETSFSLSKDPFGWNKWETSHIGEDSTVKKQDSNNYGTTFIRNNKKFLNRRRENINNTQLIRQGYSDEIAYLRQIYNGEYETPQIIADEKERQLRLLEEDKRQSQAWVENEKRKRNNQSVHADPSSFKKSILDLTDKIKHVLLNKTYNKPSPQSTVTKVEPNDDLIFIKEKKQTSLQKKRQQYIDESERFNKELLRLQNEFKRYRQLIEERKVIKDKAKKEREAEKKKEDIKLVPIISDKDLSLVNSTLKRKDNAVLFNKDNIEVSIRDFKTLAPKRWLNDTIIEFFMKNVEWNTPQTVAFNSFFYSNLSQRGHQGVRRWMKRKKVEIKDLKKIFTPINLNQSHWALGLIDLERKRIIYVDSLSRGPSSSSLAILNNLKDYVIEESKSTMGQDFELVHGNCPQQANGYDCGIFVCLNALYLSQDSELTFNGKDAANMRNYIAHRILSG